MTKALSVYAAILTAHQNVAPAGWSVFDGPQAQLPTDQSMILVGVDDPLTTGTAAAIDTGGRDWLDLGALNQSETFAVHCSIVRWTGGSSYTALMSDTDAVLSLIEAEIVRHDNTSLVMGATTGALGPTGWALLSVAEVRRIQASSGAALHVHYVISCTTRL